MKKSILAVLLCWVLCISAFAQNQRLNISGGNMSFAQVFNEIESQTGMSVDYDAQAIDLAKTVSVPSGTTTVGHLLDAILPSAGYTYTVNKSHIIIKEKPKTQAPVLKGIVVDPNGEPVIGVGVFVKGTTIGTVTTLDGSFSINADGNDVLVCSLLGYKTKEVAVGKSSYLKIVLEEDALFISDVVGVGYGVQKKENLTGAVSVVSSKSIENRSNANLGGILQGAVPGMTVTSATGRPGQGVSLNIRGWNSINTGSPLILIDGVVGSLDRVNPNDVESISVLKDASSTAIYGANASFGVVLVNTKSGGNNDGYAHVRYSSRFGYSAPTSSTDWETRGYYSVYIPNMFMQAYSGKPQVLYTEDDMAQLWARVNDVKENPARPWIVIDQSQGRNTYKYYGNTDWWHYFFNDVKPMQNHDISFRGGNKTIKYYLSANYDQEQGVFRIIPDIYRKYNLRAHFSFDAKPWLNVSNNTSFYSSVYTYPGASNTNTTFYNLSAGCADPTMDYVAYYYVNAANGFNTVRYYKNNTSFYPSGVTVTGSSQSTSSATALKSYYSVGAGWINYSAHGDSNMWYKPQFTVSDVSRMSNVNMPSVMIGNCCLTNRFNATTCFGEALLRKNSNAGAVIYIGATNSTFWDQDFYWSVGLRDNISNTMSPSYIAAKMGTYDRLFHTHGEALSDYAVTAGKMLYFGNMSVQNAPTASSNWYGTTAEMKQYYWEIYELMGDPSLMPWLGRAEVLNLTLSSDGTSLRVAAAPGAYVALIANDGLQLQAAGFAGSDGLAWLPVPSVGLENCFVSVSAQGYRPVQKACTPDNLAVDGIGLHDVGISPNPASDHAVVSAVGLQHVALIDMTGRTLQTLPASGDRCRLDLSGVPAGLYLLRLVTANGSSTGKLLVK